MSAVSDYQQLADVFTRAFGDTGTIPDALRVVDVYRLRSRAKGAPLESFRVISAAAAYFGVSVRRILARDRHHAACDARWVVARVLREQGWSMVEIATVLGLRNHTTIVHALERVNERPDLLSAARQVIESLRGDGVGCPEPLRRRGGRP